MPKYSFEIEIEILKVESALQMYTTITRDIQPTNEKNRNRNTTMKPCWCIKMFT